MRLIDNDALIEAIKNMSQRYCDCKDCDGSGQIIRVSEVIDIVKNEVPTAYSVDKVVEELEEMIHPKQLYFCKYARGGCKHLYNNDKDCMECVVENAIEIVKQGSVSDDVCEWRLCDEEANVYDTSCRNPHILIEGTPKENNYEYCPYCGKKIKFVGD